MGTSEMATPTAAERGFAVGEHVVLRPVLEKDLPELAKLLAANPCDDKPQPWTLQRLKQKFEDKDHPGLWGKSEHYFAVVRKAGGLVGFLKEHDEHGSAMYWNRLYIDEHCADRDTLGPDVIKAYMAYKRKWHNPRRVAFDVLRPEPGLGAWLEASGFERDVTFERYMTYLGQPEALCVYSWLSDEVRRNLADDGPVAGEEV
jgi:RimJ/RimL family protein N-acetyltransferase